MAKTGGGLTRSTLREQLVAFLAEVVSPLDGELDDHTSLITSGLVESTALLNLALWVEERIDPAVEISAFELSTEWDTVGRILNFVERHRPIE
jgi:acyl carrier protein